MLPNIQQLAEWTWKVTVLFTLIHVLAILLRRRSAAEKHVLWLVAVLCALALPFWPSHPAAVMTAVMTMDLPGATRSTIPTTTVSTMPATPDATFDWPLVWLLGMLALASYGLCGVMLLALRYRRGKTQSPLAGLVPTLLAWRRVRIYESPACQSPMTWGVFRPVILLPVASRAWSGEKQRAVLLHELQHIQRFDFLTQLAAQAMRALYWFHPLAWTTTAALRQESEKACDDAVLRDGQKATDYARHLLDLATLDLAAAVRCAGIPMARQSHLEGRIRSLLDPSTRRGGVTTRARFAGAGVLAGLLILVSGVAIRAQSGGALYGSVLDISRAVVPHAEVRATSANGKRVEVTSSRVDGQYRFAELPAGNYKVEARAPGFAVFTVAETEIKPGTPARLNLNLELGKVTENIDVVGKGKPAATPRAAGVPQRIRVGGNVQATRLLTMVKPDYPQHLQDQGVEGTVLLEGVISREGSLLSLHGLNSLVDPDLTRAAINAVSQWHYQPTLLNGEAVEVITTIKVNYKLVP